MSITTDYEVFSERYHIPSEMDRRQRANDKIASLEGQVLALQASEAKLTAENEKLKEECDDLQKEKFCLGFDEDVHEIVDKKYIEILKVIADKSKALTDDAFKATDQLETELKIAFRDMNKVKSKMVFFEKLYKREKKSLI